MPFGQNVAIYMHRNVFTAKRFENNPPVSSRAINHTGCARKADAIEFIYCYRTLNDLVLSMSQSVL